MARIAGVNIPDNKHVEISLTGLYGIGRKRAQEICDKAKISYSTKVSELSDDQLEQIRVIVKDYVIEGDLSTRKVKKKLGMGLSSLLSKDQELASVIRTKIKDQVNKSSLKIEMPKLSKKEDSKTNARTRKGRRKAVR